MSKQNIYLMSVLLFSFMKISVAAEQPNSSYRYSLHKGIQYGMGGMISGIMAYSLLGKVEKMEKENRYTSPSLQCRINKFGRFAHLMGGVSCTLTVLAIKESYNCHKLIKRQEE